MALCPNPKCNANLGDMKVEPMRLDGGERAQRGVAYVCPYCNRVLGAGIDPIAMKMDIVSEIVKSLRGS